MDHIDNLLRWMKGLPGTDTPHGLAAYKATAVLLGILITWLLLKWFLQRLSRRLLRYPFFKENENVLKAIRKAVRYGLVIIAGTYLARLFELSLLEKIFQGVLIVMLAAPAKVVLIGALTYLEKNVADRTDNKVDDIIFDLLNRFSGAILYVTAIILALDIVGINVMPFIAGAGVAGIAIGFAAKDTLSNLIAGVLLIIDRPFEIGDRIEVWSAPASSAAIMSQIKISVSLIKAGSMMPFLMVPTTSPPAIRAPDASKMAAIKIAPVSVSAREPTAGPTLLATSLAPIFIAM